ncbi:hypothetical protein ACQJBY_054999 [Aegilops geniculata]
MNHQHAPLIPTPTKVRTGGPRSSTFNGDWALHAAEGGIGLQLVGASTCSSPSTPLRPTATAVHHPPTAGAIAPRPFNYATSGRSTPTPCSSWMTPVVVDSIHFLPLYAASSMSYSRVLCLGERCELVRLWMLLCWYILLCCSS